MRNQTFPATSLTADFRQDEDEIILKGLDSISPCADERYNWGTSEHLIWSIDYDTDNDAQHMTKLL